MPETPAQTAGLQDYNDAVATINNAQARLAALGDRPDDIQYGADGKPQMDNTGKPVSSGAGKDWDAKHASIAKEVEDGRAQAAAAGKQYADNLAKEASDAAREGSPEALASAAAKNAQADYYRARSDGYAAHDAATEHAAQTRADAAMANATSKGARVDAQNNLSNAQAAGVETPAERAARTATTEAGATARSQIAATSAANVEGMRASSQLADTGLQGENMLAVENTRAQNALDVVKANRDAAIEAAKQAFANNKDLEGYKAALAGANERALSEANGIQARLTQAQSQKYDASKQQAQLQADQQKQQSSMAEQSINSGIKLGVAPPMALARMQFAPFQMAQQVLPDLVKQGVIDPANVPPGLSTGQAPLPDAAAAPAAHAAPAPAPPTAAAPSPLAPGFPVPPDSPNRAPVPAGAY